MECLRKLTKALENFICKPSQYPQTFVDGRTGKKNKNSNEGQGEFTKFIAENNLETIFQECFLLHIMNDEDYFPKDDREEKTIISMGMLCLVLM